MVDVDRVTRTANRPKPQEAAKVGIRVPKMPVAVQMVNADRIPSGSKRFRTSRKRSRNGHVGQQFRVEPQDPRIDQAEVREVKRPCFRMALGPILQLAEILSPVNVRVEKVLMPANRAPCELVKIRQRVRQHREAASSGPDDAS